MGTDSIRARLTPLERGTKLFVRRRIHRLRTGLAARRRADRPDALVLLVSSARCGGRLLAEYLGSVPGVVFADEVLHDRSVIGRRPRRHGKRAALRHVERSLLALPAPICGAKLTFRHLEVQGLEPADLRRLRPHPKLIVLYRRSLAEVFISLKAANQSKRWRRREGEPAFAGSVHVDPEAYGAFAEMVRGDYSALLAQPWLPEWACIVCYEDLVEDPQRVFDEVVLPFLGLPSVPITAALQKQIDRPISEVVENYDEVRALLEGEQGRQTYALG